ncbi:MAG: sialate O-acetylesterase [Mucilaginibacter sp.]
MKKLLLVPIVLFVALQGCKKTDVIPAENNTAAKLETLADAAFKISNVLGDNMVIQRDKPFTIWGKAPAGVQVGARTSWNNKLLTTTTDNNGDWKIIIPSAPANATPQTIWCGTDVKTPVIFKNILIGDVWFASGQSNMSMPVDSTGPWFGFQGVVNYPAEIAAANYPNIRSMDILTFNEDTPQDMVKKQAPWVVCTPTAVKKFSAVAYFFARKLHLDLKVPIGLVVSSAGGTYCEAWTSKATMEADPLLKSYYLNNAPSGKLYNGMVHPFRNLSIKGFIWYQGEANKHDLPTSNYTALNTAMIKSWRTVFNQGDLPFYYVQMTALSEDFWVTDPTLYDYALFKESQAEIRDKVPNSGMAITMDVGEVVNIHPRDKRPVGERLAALALNKTYKMNVPCVGPQAVSGSINNRTITVNFAPGTATGLTTKNNKPLIQFFYVAGADKKFRPGKAVISGEKIVVTASADTPLPILSVRYAFTNIAITNLQNAAGLPAEPFRYDKWK